MSRVGNCVFAIRVEQHCPVEGSNEMRTCVLLWVILKISGTVKHCIGKSNMGKLSSFNLFFQNNKSLTRTAPSLYCSQNDAPSLYCFELQAASLYCLAGLPN